MFKTITENIVYLGIVSYKNLPAVNGSNVPALTTIPDVLNLSVIVFKNTAPTTVTNFTSGAQYQSISVRGDGFTTISNNATIKTNTGVNKLLAANRMYKFILIDEVWIEE